MSAWFWLASEAASIVCVIAAATLAILGHEGWGWFLFAAVCMSKTIERMAAK